VNKNVQISELELTYLISNLIIVKMIFSFTRGLFTESGNSAWTQAVFMSLIAVVFLVLSFLAYKITGKKTIVDIAEDVGGRALKYIVALLCIFVLLINFIIEIRMFFESIKIVLLPKTKLEIIMLLIAIAVIIGSRKGIFAIATVNAIFFPVCLVFLGFIGVFLIRNYNVNNLFPIFGEGIKNNIVGGTKNLYCFADILVLNLLMPHIRDIGEVKRSGLKALLISSITLILISLCYALCYPAARSKEFLLPIYQLTRMIKAGEYFQRFEAFFEFVFTITELLYITIYVYVISETVAKTFSVPDVRILPYTTVTISFLLAYEVQSVVDAIKVSGFLGMVIAPIAFFLPIILPLLYIPKKRKESLSK